MTGEPLLHFTTESSLIDKAAKWGRLVIKAEPKKSSSSLELESESVQTLRLDGSFLTLLKEHGFTFGPGTRPPHNQMVYLSGESNQRGAEIFESDSWAWKRAATNLQLDAYFRLRINEKKRGVVCEPHVWGNCDGGACHQPTIDRLVRIMAEHLSNTSDLHLLLKRAAGSKSAPVIYWSEMGLGGVKSVGWLFEELFGRNKKVLELSRSPLSPFDPNPNPTRSIFDVHDRLFVEEVDQSRLFEQWEKQLKEFRRDLA